MTHFITGIIIPKEEINRAKEYIESSMSPYSEELEVSPYIKETKEKIKADFEEFKKDLRKQIKENNVPDYLNKYVEDGKVKKITIKDWAEGYYGNEMDEEGNMLTTWNEDSFWDWYRIGGRWDGILTDNEQSSENGFNFDDKHETIKNNSIKVSELLKKFKAKQKEIKELRKASKIISNDLIEEAFFGHLGFADIFREFFKTTDLTKEQGDFYDNIKKRLGEQIKDYEFYNPYSLPKIIVEGQVFGGKDFGWFGTSTDTKEIKDWEKEFEKLLEKHKNDYIINLDCHV